MKKLLIILIVGFIAFGFNGCKCPKPPPCPTSTPPSKVVVQYFLGVVDNDPGYRYFVKFDEYDEAPITPNTLFHLDYTYNAANTDSLVVKVIAKKPGVTIPIAWYIQHVDYTHRAANDTLYLSNICYGPEPGAVPPASTEPGPVSQPVPVGVTSPSSNQRIP